VTVHAETIASAIRIGDPASWDRAVRAIRETDGVVTSVTDDEIMEAKAVIDASGVGCEPASAASLAGVKQLVARGVIAPTARVACVLTGHMLKDPDAMHTYHTGKTARANPPLEIDASVREVERVLKAR
jgi:threonine synthase